ncbi:UDP-N-acetylmuramate dehydrogenase [Phosphitispora fastidiosa]|uniref:UDP-N-acetylmuramate dehydrogenase n=1 Tax=Phosphitispora fastidiosa TaxID=2837202 RepID=UPI001E48A92E|nr:UDP-N-acetylmuramate dehydrogenase [Phosphitispora fastidiosa]MBU7005634.1 UDP-N-acetylmuramate dehydrogenase [Phosphitispora fastidiosa]
MDPCEIEQSLEKLLKGEVKSCESMKNHTSWRVGGPADIMVLPSSIEDIRLCQQFAIQQGLPLTVMGNGSNMLVKDGGIRGIVLKISRGFNQIEVKGTVITAEAGVFIPTLSARAAREGLTGMEFAAGIPASVGGAVSMNAGAHGKSMADVVRGVTALTGDGNTVSLEKEEIGFSYRKSGIPGKGLVILTADFDLKPGEPEEIMAANKVNLEKRRRSQPLEFPTAGSVFANPPGQWAGWLIENAGCKGMRIGDAMVSDKHANFIVNLGMAKAEDILQLITRIKNLVMQKYQIELELEVRVVGE